MYPAKCLVLSPLIQKAIKKKQLVEEGKLGKYGKILESTPAEVRAEFGEKPAATVETLSAITTATPTAAALPATRKVCGIKKLIDSFNFFAF